MHITFLKNVRWNIHSVKNINTCRKIWYTVFRSNYRFYAYLTTCILRLKLHKKASFRMHFSLGITLYWILSSVENLCHFYVIFRNRKRKKPMSLTLFDFIHRMFNYYYYYLTNAKCWDICFSDSVLLNLTIFYN